MATKKTEEKPKKKGAPQNLNPVRSKAEAIERGRKGGKASGEARRRKKELRECLEILLEKDIKSRSGETMSGAEAISAKLFEKALHGDIRAFEVIRDTAGQKPVDKIQVAEVDQATVDSVEALFNDKRPSD